MCNVPNMTELFFFLSLLCLAALSSLAIDGQSIKTFRLRCISIGMSVFYSNVVFHVGNCF